MPYDLETKDGIVLRNVPDEIDPNGPEARARVTAEREKRAAEAKEPSSPFMHKAKLFAGDVAKGLAGLPVLAGELANKAGVLDAFSKLQGYTGFEEEEAQPSQAPFGTMMGIVQRTGEQPQTPGEKWQSLLTQGAAGGLTGPGGLAKPVTNMLTGMGGATGGEVAADVFGDNFATRLAGSLLGGGVTGLAANKATSLRPQTQTLAREALEGIPPELLQKAQAFQASMAQRGVTVDFAQALDAVGAPSTNAGTLRNVLAQSQAGTKVQKTLRDQPTQLELESDLMLGKMPGTAWGEQQAANNLAEAATKTIGQAKENASNLWANTLQQTSDQLSVARKPAVNAAAGAFQTAKQSRQQAEAALNDLYTRVRQAREGAPDYVMKQPIPEEGAAQARVGAARMAETEAAKNFRLASERLREVKAVPPEVVSEQIVRLRQLARSVPNTPKAAMLEDLANSLTIDGRPLTSAYQINEVLKAASAKTKTINLNTPGVDKAAANYLHSQVASLRENLGTAFEPIRAANEAFKRYQAEIVAPLKQGPIGQIAGRGGYSDVTQTPVTRVFSLFKNGVDPRANNSPIRSAANEFAKAGHADEFADAAKTYWSTRISEAFDPRIGGSPATNADAAHRIWKGLFSDAKQYQAAKDTVTSVAKHAGLSERQAAKGLETYAMMVKAMSNRPSNVGGLRAEEVFQLGGQNYGSDALRIFGFLPFNTAARRLEDRVLRNVFTDLDNLLTTPDGAKKLIELSKVPVMSQKAVTLFSSLGGAAPQMGGITQE